MPGAAVRGADPGLSGERGAAPAPRLLRIALLTVASSWGGTEVHTTQLAEALARRSHSVTVLQVGHRIYEATLGAVPQTYRLDHIALPSGPFERVGLLGWLGRLRKLEADVVVLVKPWFLATTLALESAIRLRFGTYGTIEHHPADPMKPRSSARHLGGLIPGLGVWWYAVRIRDHVLGRMPGGIVAVSDTVKRNLVSYHGYPAAKIRRVYNGVDTGEFRPDPVLRAKTRAAWGIPSDALVFGAVGRIHPIKGYRVALESFERLVRGGAPAGRDVRLVIAGLGPEREELQAAAARAGLADAVLLPGWAEHARDALCALDVFLMPSLQEGLGISLLEAMSCGCYAIAMGVGGVPEVLSSPDIGVLVPPGDREGFFRAMRDAAVLSPEQRQAVGGRARRHVAAHFEARTQFAAIVSFVEELAAK